jgi:hypothetical protein
MMPKSFSLAGSTTETVFELWSARYTRSRALMAISGALAAPGTWLASAVVRLPAMIVIAITATFPVVRMP